jgi:hypothetical protein
VLVLGGPALAADRDHLLAARGVVHRDGDQTAVGQAVGPTHSVGSLQSTERSWGLSALRAPRLLGTEAAWVGRGGRACSGFAGKGLQCLGASRGEDGRLRVTNAPSCGSPVQCSVAWLRNSRSRAECRLVQKATPGIKHSCHGVARGCRAGGRSEAHVIETLPQQSPAGYYASDGRKSPGSRPPLARAARRIVTHTMGVGLV